MKDIILRTDKNNNMFCMKCKKTVHNWDVHQKSRIHGSGLMDWIKNTFSKRIDGFNNLSMATLKKYGNLKIVSLRIFRKPLTGIIQDVLNLISLNKFSDAKKKYSFDNMFHLGCLALLENKKTVQFEKVEAVKFYDGQKISGSDVEYFDVSISGDKTLNEMTQKAREKVGDKLYFDYDGFENNCQKFIMYNLKYGLDTWDNNIDAFVMQNIDDFKNEFSPITKQILKVMTDAGQVFNKITGGKFKKRNLKGGKLVEEERDFGGEKYKFSYNQEEISEAEMMMDPHFWRVFYDYEDLRKKGLLHMASEYPQIEFTGKWDNNQSNLETGLIMRLMEAKLKKQEKEGNPLPLQTMIAYQKKDWKNRNERYEAAMKAQKEFEKYQIDRQNPFTSAFWRDATDLMKNYSIKAMKGVASVIKYVPGYGQAIGEALDKGADVVEKGIDVADKVGLLGKKDRSNIGTVESGFVKGGKFHLHSIKINNSISKTQQLQHIKNITKSSKKRMSKEKNDFTVYRIIPKTKFEPKSYITKKVKNGNIHLVFGKLKNEDEGGNLVKKLSSDVLYPVLKYLFGDSLAEEWSEFYKTKMTT